jgi:hypothetical protein
MGFTANASPKQGIADFKETSAEQWLFDSNMLSLHIECKLYLLADAVTQTSTGCIRTKSQNVTAETT